MASSFDPAPAELATLSDEQLGRALALLLCRGRSEQHDLRLQQLLVEHEQRSRRARSDAPSR